jgi:hypothetical protein
MGRLPHTFGHERIGYSCGTLFVDHASGKILNFCQYSTNADETITNKHRLDLMQGKMESLLKDIMQIMVSLLQKLSRRIVTCYINCILLAVLEHTIKMVLLNGILKQSRNGLRQTCCILLITGQPKLKSASGHRQLKGSTKCTLCGIVLFKLNTFFSHVFACP